MVQSIIFDLSEVLIKGIFGTETELAKVLQIDQSMIVPALYDDVFFSLLNGRTSERTYIDQLIDKNRWPIEADELKEVIRSNFTEIQGTRNVIHG